MITRRAIVSSRAYLLVLTLIPAAAAWSGVAGCSSSNAAAGHGGAGGGGNGGGLGGGGGFAGGSGGGLGGGGGSGDVPDAAGSDTASPDAAGDAAPSTDGPSGDATQDVQADAPVGTPTIAMLTPASAHVGDPGFTLIVDGNDFPTNPRVTFDGNLFNTTVVSATRVQAQIPSAALGATPRQVIVRVTRIESPPATSNALTFTILAAQGQGGAANN